MGAIKAQRGNEAAFIQRQIDSLADYGLKPIDTNNIVSSITAKLNDPKIGPSDVNQAVLSKVANKIQEWTAKGGGIIDADALYSIRKNAVGEEIARLYPNADAKQQARFAAKLLTEIKPAIDDAIVDAGGTGWRRYLQTYETGMKELDQQKLAALALEKFNGSKEEFIKLVRGNNPDAVEAIFGPGSYDIFKEMGSKMPTLEKVASNIERAGSMEAAAVAGKERLGEVISDVGRTFPRFPNLLSRETAIGNLTFSELEKRLDKKVVAKLREGALSGKNSLELLNALPAVERSKVLKVLTDPSTWGARGAAVTRAAAMPVAPTNNLAPEPRNQNALAR